MKKKILHIFIIFLLSIFSYSSSPNDFKNIQKIKKVLKTDSYAYLTPIEKDFIKDYYLETGQILLTEANKKENEPYYNPSYGVYLNLSTEEQANVEEIPLPITLDTQIVENNGVFASSYDLRNVDGNGKSYITEMKDQGDLGLCWAFTLIEQTESLLLKNANQGATPSSQTFSVRQFDYASSHNSIRDYTNEYAMYIGRQNNQPVQRNVGDPGNFLIGSKIAADGIGFIDDSLFPYNDTDKSKKELQNILNYNNSLYELNESIVYQNIGTRNTVGSRTYYYGLDANSTTLTNFKNTVKQLIMEYGGVYVASQGPGYSCAVDTTGTDALIRIDESCIANAGHAMQIIGWDDSYTYSYCKMGSEHKPASECDPINRVTGQGAWLLRNSWGTQYPYIHLAYDTYYEAVYVTKRVTPKANRTWENNYVQSLNSGYFYTKNVDTVDFEKKINTPEVVKEVKFHSFSQNGKFRLSVRSFKYDENNDKVITKSYYGVKEITVSEVGYATFDLSNQDIIITGDYFDITIESVVQNGESALFAPDTISVFTANYDDDPKMETEFYRFTSLNTTHKIKLYANTKNIPSNTEISFDLRNEYGESYSSKITNVQYNKIAENNLNAIVTISSSLPEGLYDLYAIYTTNSGDTFKYPVKVLANKNFSLDGYGTESSPYIITNEEQLRMMSVYTDAYYRLNNDITLTKNWVPIGSKERPFTGSFDGGNHTITGLVVPTANQQNGTIEYDYGGLFGYVKIPRDTSASRFENIRFVNSNVWGKKSAGTLIGTIIGEEGYSWDRPSANGKILKVFTIGGDVYSNGNAGAIVGTIGKPEHGYNSVNEYTINHVFSSSNVGGKESSGMFGEIQGSFESGDNYRMLLHVRNIEFLGAINLNHFLKDGITPTAGTHASIFGKLLSNAELTLEYVITSPLYLGFYSSLYYGYISNDADFVIPQETHPGYSYIYNALDSDINMGTLKDEDIYKYWPNFSSKWEIKVVNGIKRIPVLVGADIPYSPNLPGFNITEITDYHYGDYTGIEKYILQRYYAVSESNSSIISAQNISDPASGHIFDVIVHPKKAGGATIRFVSTYDGYERDSQYKIYGPIEQFSVSNGTAITLGLNQTHTITTALTPPVGYTTDDSTITWQVLECPAGDNECDRDAVSVNSSGVVTALKYGTATVQGILANGMHVEVAFSVKPPLDVFEINGPTSITKVVGETYQLTTIVSPPEAGSSSDVIWSSSDEEIATVSSTGLVTAVAYGTATITGTIQNTDVTLTINVVDAVETFVVTNGTDITKIAGTSHTIETTIAPSTAGTSEDITWTSNNTEVATVNSSGVVFSRKAGQSTITGTIQNRTVVVIYTVQARVNSVQITNGTTKDLQAEGTHQIEVTIDATAASSPAYAPTINSMTWTSSNTGVATVSTGGLVTGVAAGTATITGTIQGKSVTLTVNVKERINRFEITNGTTAEITVGNTYTVQTVIEPSDTYENKTITWTSNNTGIATVNSNGRITGVHAGETTVVGQLENNMSVQLTVIVRGPIESIVISNGTSITMNVSNTHTIEVAFTPEKQYIYQSTTITWLSSNTNIATVNSLGTVTAVEKGSVTITGSLSNGMSVTCNITVLKPITRYEVTNGTTVSILEGETHTIITAIEPNDTTDSKIITWTSTNTAVATVNPSGEVTSVGLGTTTIRGTLPNEMYVEVELEVEELILFNSITASQETIYISPTTSYKLEVQFNPTSATERYTWTSSDPTIATVDATGTVSGTGVGTTTVIVQNDRGISTEVQVVVENTQRPYTKCDLDHNGSVNIQDVVIALKKIFKYLPEDNNDVVITDTNNNDELDISDVVQMLKYIFKYIDEL